MAEKATVAVMGKTSYKEEPSYSWSWGAKGSEPNRTSEINNRVEKQKKRGPEFEKTNTTQTPLRKTLVRKTNHENVKTRNGRLAQKGTYREGKGKRGT